MKARHQAQARWWVLAVMGAVLLRAEEARPPKPPAEITVAVIDFDNVSGQELANIGRVAHDVLNSYLVGLPGVSVVKVAKNPSP